jgi:hypothetical protein
VTVRLGLAKRARSNIAIERLGFPRRSCIWRAVMADDDPAAARLLRSAEPRYDLVFDGPSIIAERDLGQRGDR